MGENFIASDVFALLPVTQRFIFLEVVRPASLALPFRIDQKPGPVIDNDCDAVRRFEVIIPDSDNPRVTIGAIAGRFDYY